MQIKIHPRILSVLMAVTVFLTFSIGAFAASEPETSLLTVTEPENAASSRAVSGSASGSGSDFWIQINSPSNSVFAHFRVEIPANMGEAWVEGYGPDGRVLIPGSYKLVPPGYTFRQNILNAPAGTYRFRIIATTQGYTSAKVSLHDWYF